MQHIFIPLGVMHNLLSDLLYDRMERRNKGSN